MMKTITCVLICSVAAHRTWADDRFEHLAETYCVACHNASTTEGEFNLESVFRPSTSPAAKARLFERIKVRVSSGEMPPADADPLADLYRQELLDEIDRRMDRLADLLRDDPGRVAMARLTPYEYRNVVRDLSERVVRNAGRFLPNEGGAGEGFANVGAAQVMTLPQYEKYVHAAKDVLRHLRVYPGTNGNPAAIVWTSFPRPAVDTPAQARKEVIDEIIGWHVRQQQKWGEEHRQDLEKQLGFVHAAYLEAAWYYAKQMKAGEKVDGFASIAINPGGEERVALAPAALQKWLNILNSRDTSSPHAAWAVAWRKLLKQDNFTPAELRRRCTSIVAGSDAVVVETEDFAPPYEISFHEAKQEVLEAAEKKGHWPFRIEIGDAKELFLIVTDAGDGNRGEYAVWRRGRFVFKDGSSRPWQEVVTIVGARSGRQYPFGYDGEKSKVLSNDAVGAKPPGSLKFTVPPDAIVFEVDLTLDENRTERASIQALVLKQNPRSSSYVPGRFVFGGKKRPVTAGAKLKKEQERALRKRNVSEANKTKIGLNAERNVFAAWDRTSLESLGGPWPDQDVDTYETGFPYHYTVAEVLRNSGTEDLAELTVLQDRLVALVQAHDEEPQPEQLSGLLTVFATRAWRRDVTRSEMAALQKLYRNSRTSGLSFDTSVKTALLLVLSSPHFIYKQLEPVAGKPELSGGSSVPLSSSSLATRLSFFLWGSLPDSELLELASRNELRKVDMLRKQARRMLKDSRARSLATDFAGQLWGFSDFRTFDNPDLSRFPEFTPRLRAAMVGEVETFLSDVFQNERPLTNLLSADYTFLNKDLAEHYDVLFLEENLDSSELSDGSAEAEQFKRVRLPAERGGLPTMGLFLTRNSLPLRTSPVQRGVWVLENMLGRHLPSPPADVPSISEDDSNPAGENIRQQLERHRAQASCASCHSKIDPLGISLESFDAIGRWRIVERDGSPLVTSSVTHDGVQLTGSVSLKSYLLQHKDEFIRYFNRRLLGYALGRAVHIGDKPLLDRMQMRLQVSGTGFAALVDEIVASPQFRMKRVENE